MIRGGNGQIHDREPEGPDRERMISSRGCFVDAGCATVKFVTVKKDN